MPTPGEEKLYLPGLARSSLISSSTELTGSACGLTTSATTPAAVTPTGVKLAIESKRRFFIRLG